MELISEEASRADIRVERGALYMKQSQYYKASKELTMATKLNGNDIKVWQQLGSARMCLGDFKECFEAFKKGLALDPNNVDIWSSLAQAHKEVRSLVFQVYLFIGSIGIHISVHRTVLVVRNALFAMWVLARLTARTVVTLLPIKAHIVHSPDLLKSLGNFFT